MLKDELVELLDGDDFEFTYTKDKGDNYVFYIKHSAMYSAPTLQFAKLKKLSEIFGTEKIDVDDFGHGGCETCDYGSEYGHEITLINPTKNVNEFKSFAEG